MAENPAVVLPRRVIGKARSQTPYSSAKAGEAIRRDDASDLNKSIRDSRSAASAAAAMRAHFETSDLLSTAVAQFVAMASGGFTIKCYDTATQEFSKAGTLAAEAVLASLSSEWDYSTGYSDKRGLPALLETMLLEVLLTGGVGLELVLDKYRLPRDLHVFPYDSVTFISKGNGRKVPAQKDAQGNLVELDLPTVFIGESMKPSNRKYCIPLLHSGLTRLFNYAQLTEDAWRVVTRAGMSRLVVKLDYEKVVASAAPEVRNDPAKLSSYLEEVRTVHQTVLSDLSPDDALVTYSLAEVTALKVTGEKAELSDLLTQMAGLVATALKSNPSALGLRVGGSQNTGTVESMLATKTAKLFQGPVQEVMSKALTLACRLYGVDVYTEFSYQEIDLRPLNELEAHLAIKQNRVLELLSLGRITDDESQAMLGLGSLPPQAEQLAGTGFHDPKAPDSLPVAATNSRNRQISPDTPTSSGGADNAQTP